MKNVVHDLHGIISQWRIYGLLVRLVEISICYSTTSIRNNAVVTFVYGFTDLQ